MEYTRLLEKTRVERNWSPSRDGHGRNVVVPLPREVICSLISLSIDCNVPAPCLNLWICMEVVESFLEIHAIHSTNAAPYPIHNGRIWRENRTAPLFWAGPETSPADWSLRRAGGRGIVGPPSPCFFTSGRHLPPDLVKGKGTVSPVPSATSNLWS